MGSTSSTLPVLETSDPDAGRQAFFAMSAGFLGWTLDAFDYFLVIMAVPRIAATFGVTKPQILVSVTLTLAMRPVGAFIFGLLADRYGRRIPMILNLIFYSSVEVATAFAPNLTTFLILRALFGIGMGGEWGVGASLVMEKVPAKWRGVLSGLLQEGYAAGFLLAGLASYLMLDRFGWRPMFLLGGAPAILALFIRFAVKESKVWEKNKADSWSNLAQGIASHWKLWIYLTLLMAAMNFASHGTQDAFPTYLQTYRHLTEKASSEVVMIMMVGAITGGVAFGLASDRFGRRAMMIVAFVGALAVIYWWAFSSTFGNIVLGAIFMQFMIQGAWGIIPAHINELSPTQVRGFLPGFSYQCGNLIASWIGLLQTSLSNKKYSYPNVLTISTAIIFVMAIIIISLGREKKAVEF